ncbi:DMT family transporter [Mammaliicoccus sciuri]|uniref:DMT family transporter n=1 Tax=Mammaliicoccus sciuri TaxID=1296 RepID=UPI002DB85EAE|nr:EamA family transporter [Mammaliicoccus sciuri]MEB7769108.1 DMT family transporter [Mammaliicoccus sciuri]MEB7818235.1 DMT family transporter [Mammaliicoccus sciuri]
MKALLQFIASMVIFGTIGLIIKQINIKPVEIAMLSSFIGCAFLILIYLIRNNKLDFSFLKKYKWLMFVSSLALAGNWVFLFQSYQYTSIANATLGYYFGPIIVLLLSPFILKEPLTKKSVLCIISSLIGLILILSNGFLQPGSNDVLGILISMLAGSCYAGLMITNKFIKQGNRMDLTIFQLGITSLILLAFVFLISGKFEITSHLNAIPFIVFLGVINTGIGFWLFFSGMEKLNGQNIALLSYIDPLVAIFISGLILREHFTVLQIIGGVILITSTFFSEFSFKRIRIRRKQGF